MKKKFKIERNYIVKKIRIVSFVDEVIKNGVNCVWFDFMKLLKELKILCN